MTDTLDLVDRLENLEGLSDEAALDVLEAGLECLGSRERTGSCDAETALRVVKLRAQLDCVAAQMAADFDASAEWATSGAKTAPAWLTKRCRLPSKEATRLVRRGRALRHLPHSEAAWSEGTLGAAHLDVLARARNERTKEAFERDEEMLVEAGRQNTFADFVRIVRYWEQHADPDGAEDEAMAQRFRRDVFLAESISGSYLGSMILDPISGAIVSGELERLERILFEVDWAEAERRLGRAPQAVELGRTSAQRRADALVEMAARSASQPEGARRPAPLFSVLVGYETLHGPICQLANGQRPVLTPGSLVPWLCEADIERAVFSPGGRVEVGITARFYSGATRRAIELRDQRCIHPYCDAPPERCQVDHVLEYSKGGKTTQENGRLLCDYHNRLRNQRPPPGG